jgi:hypothetical protein
MKNGSATGSGKALLFSGLVFSAVILAGLFPAPVHARDGSAMDFLERYLGPPGRFGFLAEGGYAADFWNPSFEDDGPSNVTTAEVSRDPYLLVVGGINLYNILGYIDWNITYRTDNVTGYLDLTDSEVETGPGEGNTEINSLLQVPLGLIGLPLGALGASEENVYWLNYLRFQFAPTERYFRWETNLKGAAEYIDAQGQAVTADGPILFPARYSERRYSLVLGTWPLVEDGWGTGPDAAIIAGGSWEAGYMTMEMTSPMQFRLRRPDTISNIAVRQFITTNEASGFYTRLTLGDAGSALDLYPDAVTVVLWGDFFSGSTTLTTGLFEVSNDTAELTTSNDLGTGNLVARRFGFGGGFYKQHGFGRQNNGRFRWGVNAYWHMYAYGPADLGFVSSTFNQWETELTSDFAGLEESDTVWVDFFRREQFWGVTLEAAIRF